MKFYYLMHNWDRIQEIGCFPQASGLKMIAFNLNEVLSRVGSPGNIVPPEPIVDKKAKLTSLLSVGSVDSLIFLVFEKKFVGFLNDFSLSKYETWPIKIHNNKEVLNEYLLFHITNPCEPKHIDFAHN